MVGALLVVAAVSLAATTIIERQSLLASTLAHERDRAQAHWLLLGAMDWSRLILYLDERQSAITHKEGLWARPIAGLQIDDPGSGRQAVFSGRIEDEQGKFNLYNLATDKQIAAAVVQRLERLFSFLDIPPSLATRVAQRIAQAQAGKKQSISAPGLRTIQDLNQIEGFTTDMIQRLRPYLTILPQHTLLNLNTASAETMAAYVDTLTLAQARQLTSERDHGLWFNNSADFWNRIDQPAAAQGKRLETRSRWFLVSGEVSLDHVVVGMQALLYREGSGAATVRWIRQ